MHCMPTTKLCRHYQQHRSSLPHHLNLVLNQPDVNPTSPQSEIRRLCDSGLLSRAIQLLNSTDPIQLTLKPNVFSSLLHACTKSLSFPHGLQIHSHVVKSGLVSDRFVGNSLLSLYFKLSPDFSDTRKVFDDLCYRDTVSWTSMVSGYVRAGKSRESVEVFREMMCSEMEPNGFTLSAVIKACSELGDLMLGRCFHGMVLGLGFGSNHVIFSALVDMYGRNYALDDAVCVFGEMLVPDAISWTSAISAFTRNDRFEEALQLFYSMHRKHGLVPDDFTFGTLFTALGNLGRVRQSKEVHAKVIVSGHCGNVVVESSMVDMYAKCGFVLESRQVFDRMPSKNAVSWCALLGGYCQNGDYESVLENFQEMDKEDENYSFGTVLRACAGLSVVRQGKEVHCQFLRGGRKDVVVESALVDLYAKCGFVDYAYRVFVKMGTRNLITWNAMICGFAKNGRGHKTVEVFNKMIEEGIRPDYISFIGVLFACSHSGLVEEGKKYFISMINDYGINAGIEHYNCMVDLLGRAELLEEAKDLINNAPFREDPSLWETLLGACTTYSNPDVAERVAKKMIELDPDYHLSYILLANIYKTIGRWEDALKIRAAMKERGVRKSPGKSWIDVQSNISSYLGCTDLDNNENLANWTVECVEDDVELA